jgi:uncharacterized protein (DUF58 family)
MRIRDTRFEHALADLGADEVMLAELGEKVFARAAGETIDQQLRPVGGQRQRVGTADRTATAPKSPRPPKTEPLPDLRERETEL